MKQPQLITDFTLCCVQCVPVGQPLPPEMTLAQLLTLLYDRKLPQGYQSINLTVKLGSKIISDPGLSKTDSFKRLRTEKGTKASAMGGGASYFINGHHSEFLMKSVSFAHFMTIFYLL